MEKKIQITTPFFNREEYKEVKEVIDSGWLTQGPKVETFEKKFAKYNNSKFSIALNSCTSGLHLMLEACDVKRGDEVIVPSFTWISTANAVEYTGAKPIFVDVDISTFNINIEEVIKKINHKTKAIIVVHLFGLCVNVELLKSKIPKKIKIFEDCACAVGASYNGIRSGNLGEAGVFSFHPRKLITTGEGGMLTTNNYNIAKKIIEMRNHGASLNDFKRHKNLNPSQMPNFNLLGYNYRMTDIQAAIGTVQLKKIKSMLIYRDKLAKIYIKKLRNLEWLNTPIISKDFKHSWQAFVISLNNKKIKLNRNEIMDILKKKGIATRPGTHAIHMLSYYKKKYKLEDNQYPNSKYCYENSIALPLHNKMKISDVNYVIKELIQLK
ncbi:DegT/DnrJ/EryC1/StrS family aminotransferase [Pelagibacteraceae bacterium]|nr:DegT/DnrJ/EryC1/StrS family aminotransferase [Pelagibacteraceae bacterium]